MPKLLLLACCGRVVIDQRNNNASLVDLVDEVALLKTQNIYAVPLEIFMLWEKGDPADDAAEEFEARLTLCNPNGEPGSYTLLQNKMDMPRLRNIVTMMATKLAMQGRYRWVVELQQQDGGWTVVGELPLTVTQVDIPPRSPKA